MDSGASSAQRNFSKTYLTTPENYQARGGSDDLVNETDRSEISSLSVPQIPDTATPGNEGNKGDASKLENELTNEQLRRLQEVFEEADEDGGGGLDMEEFRIAMRQTMGDHITDEELDMIFMKVDTNCDGTVDWDEYLTYMLLECREKDLMQVQSRQPFPRSFRIIQSEHKDSFVRIAFLPQLIQNAKPGQRFFTYDDKNGRYVTVSKEGVITFWDSEFRKTVVRRVEPLPPQKSVWVTDMALMPRANMIVVSTTNRSLIFYHMSGNRFDKVSMVTELRECTFRMYFWNHPTHTCKPVLLLGDDKGGITVITFAYCPGKSGLHPKAEKQTKNKYLFDEIVAGHVQNVKGYHLRKVHEDVVWQVMFSHQMSCILSCSKDDNQSLAISDIERQQSVSYIKVNGGINSFDYNFNMNIIVTGGFDTIIRVWNPYVTSKPLLSLKGHKSQVIHVLINQEKEHIISISENKEIHVHDMMTQTCIQSFYRKMVPDMGPRIISVAYFNCANQALLIGTTMLALLQHNQVKEIKLLISHPKRVTVVLYNPLFQQVVTGGVDSLVCVWSAITGEKVMQFKAHVTKNNGYLVDNEITAMTFDPTYRRLITAARDGSAKVWNFNNGACLREIPTLDKNEITSIICPKDRIATGGWDKQISIFFDKADDETVKVLTPHPRQDVLTMAYYPPNLLAAGCHDGSVLVWTLDTRRLVFFTKAGGSGRPQSFTILDYLINQSPRDIEENDDSDDRFTFKNENCIVEKLLFLPKRQNNKDTATLFAACSDGMVRAYAVHHEGGLKGEFQAQKNSEDVLLTMVTNEDNNLLITGDTSGYIRVWDISHHYINGTKCNHKNHEERKEFWTSFMYFRRKMMKLNSDKTWSVPFVPSYRRPHLINSFQAHVGPVSSLDYAVIYEREMLVSCSSDQSIRLWSISGKFFGVFGQPTLWTSISRNMNESRSAKPVALPSDVRRVASSTTLRVIKGGKARNWSIGMTIVSWLGKGLKIKSNDPEEIVEEQPQVKETKAEENILGKSYQRQRYHRPLPNLEVQNNSLIQCPAYRALPYAEVPCVKVANVCDLGELKRIQKSYKLHSLKHTQKNIAAIRRVGWLASTFNNNQRHGKTGKKRRITVFHKRTEGSSSDTSADPSMSIPSTPSQLTDTSSRINAESSLGMMSVPDMSDSMYSRSSVATRSMTASRDMNKSSMYAGPLEQQTSE